MAAPSPTRLAVVGAGFMARRRATALLATGRVKLVAVAAAHRQRAEALATELGARHARDDFRQLAALGAEAVLVEVPHHVQDEVVLWALEAGLHTLVGGPLSSSLSRGRKILAAAEERGLVVEAGFEARYKKAWEEPRRRIAAGEIGLPIAVRATALWNGRPDSWYYQQAMSGGMPLTHMTYCFLNPLRWLFGDPVEVAAFANRKKHTASGLVEEETCVASLRFPDDVLGSLVAGFVEPGGEGTWMASVLGTEGSIDIFPTEMENGSYRVYRGESVAEVDCAGAPDAFLVQAGAFLDAIAGEDRCRNRPGDVLGDLAAAEAIVTSVRTSQTVLVPG